MVSFYMDVNVEGPITRGLRQRGIDVMTAQEDGTDELPDEQLLDRAAVLGRLVFTHDDDFLAEASRRQSEGVPFIGVLYIHQRDTLVGRCINDLETVASASDLDEYANQVRYLPL